MTFGYRSQWIAWIALDVINVVIWWNQLASGGPAALSMLVLQVAMLLNALYGAWCWFKSDGSVDNG
jgi:nicotinamide mononucleotide transporter